MVVFTCQKCNTTLKKNAVERHFSCRPFFLTCIDCLKDFKGKEYEEHKTCISEAQKYGGANFVAKAQGVKQEQWMEFVAEALKNLSSNNRFKNICKAIMPSANIPRNRAKFNNYIKSAHPRLYDEAIVNEIFDHLEAEKKSSKNRTSENSFTNTTRRTDEKTACSRETSVTSEPKKIKGVGQNSVNDNSGPVKNTREESSHMEHNGKSGNEIVEEKELSNLEESSNIDSHKKKKKKNKEKNRMTTDDPSTSSNNSSHQFTYEIVEGEELLELDKSFQINESLQKNKKRKKESFYSKMKMKKKLINSLSFDQKTRLDCWFNIQKQTNQDNKKKNIDGVSTYILSEEQNSLLTNKNENNIDSNKLSRKKAKLLKKQKKYAAEINEIENFKPEEISDNDVIKIEGEERETNIREINFSCSSKRKHNEECRGDDPEKKMKISLNETLQIEETQNGPGKKFKWGNVIKEVLQSNSDKVLSLKKLRKKVMNEYSRQKGDDVPYEKLLGIFNKKVNKTVGVKVLKDRVTLVANDDNS